MPRTGLSQKYIIQTAVDLIEEKGISNFSLHELARRLGIRTPSLYNHFSGIQELQIEVSRYAERQLVLRLRESARGKHRDDAFRAIARAQMNFAGEHPELYALILGLPGQHDPRTDQAAADTTEPINAILREYRVSAEDVPQLQRMFRSIVHGFISLHQAGYLHHQSTSMEVSFEASINYYLELLHYLEATHSIA